MPRLKTVLTVALVLGLGGLALYMNMDWFSKRPIQISYRISPWMRNAPAGRRRPVSDLGTPIVFSLDSYYRLTSVKVVIAAEIETNKYAHPLWDLATTSNSIPTASFTYGERIRGLTSAVKGAVPDPLVPGVIYRLFVKTKGREAQRDFTTTPAGP